MIRDIEGLGFIFQLSKYVKKPIIGIYPDGRVVGTDEQFASFNMIISDKILNDIKEYNFEFPYIIISTEISAFMRNIQANYAPLIFSRYEIATNRKKQIDNVCLVNHLELNYYLEDLYNKTMITLSNKILYKEENFQNLIPDMFSLKVSDGAKMYSFGVDNKFLMSSFNSIHPANKSDKVDLIIRDHDEYSYTAEFIINKKKENYQLHEFLRFRKI